MLDLFTRLPRLPFKSALPKALPNPSQMMARNRAQQRVWPGALIGYLVDHLLAQGSFCEALDSQPGFTPRRSAEGAKCLRNESRLAGAQLTSRTVALQFALTDAETFAGSTLTPLLQARFGPLPTWRAGAEGLAMTLSLAPGVTLDLRLRDARVDPLFIGHHLPGLKVDLAVQFAD